MCICCTFGFIESGVGIGFLLLRTEEANTKSFPNSHKRKELQNFVYVVLFTENNKVNESVMTSKVR